MRKGETLRASYILLCGMAFPQISGLINNHRYSIIEFLGLSLYFFLIFFLFTLFYSALKNLIDKSLGNTYKFLKTLAGRQTLLFLCSLLFFAIMSYSWLQISKEALDYAAVFRGGIIGGCFALIYGLIMEIKMVKSEINLSRKINLQLDNERISAALTSLSNELDLHFLFNSLTTLSHLISTDVTTAHQFNQKLAQVYKYILVNKDREMVSLPNELDFIQDYFFLLQLRHEGKLELDIKVDRNSLFSCMVLPGSLQQLVENAIKHNEFSKTNPLQIKIQMNGSFVKVMNNVQPKSTVAVSTKVGLRNLSNRYMLLCNKNIIVEEHKNYFIVKIPLINQTSFNVKDNYN